MEILGYIAAAAIGISLGLIGGGGSILTVPVLVYLFQVETVTATGYSLFIVGATSAVGAVGRYRQGTVDLRTAMIFGAPSILAVYLTRRFLVPALPDTILSLGSFTLTKPILLMGLFALLMIAASVSMIRAGKEEGGASGGAHGYNYLMILLEGTVVGVLTGLVGAGGGFLIIPALVLLARLPMKLAVGTSLAIIAAKSLIGFLGDLSQGGVEWTLLLSVTGLAIGGIFLGNILSSRISAKALKQGFGWFVLLMGIYILLRETGILPGSGGEH
jgi:hypothetical protein